MTAMAADDSGEEDAESRCSSSDTTRSNSESSAQKHERAYQKSHAEEVGSKTIMD